MGDVHITGDVLANVPLFESFSPEERTALVARAQTIRVDAGTMLFREGDEGDALYVLLEGTVRVSCLDESGTEVELARVGPGDFIGEIALLDGGPRSATVATLTPGAFLVLDRDEFFNLVSGSSALASKLLKVLSRRVRTISGRVVRDELERRVRTAEAELARQRAITHAVTGLAHELNTPLGACVTMASHLDDLLSMMPERAVGHLREAAGLMRANLERAVGLVEAFRSLATEVGEDRSALDLWDLLDQAMTLVIAEPMGKRLDLSVTGPDQVPWVGFREPMLRSFVELLVNVAAHAYPDDPGGRVEVAFALCPDCEPAAWTVRIRDYGRGIAPELRAKLFDAFFTTARGRGHKGLGLTVVYNAVAGVLGGRITVEPTPGGGTTVTLFLPREG